MPRRIFEIKVADDSISNSIVVVLINSIIAQGNTTFEDAIEYCVRNMTQDEDVQIGQHLFSQKLIALLDVAVKAGLAELKNPLPQPKQKTWQPKEIPTLKPISQKPDAIRPGHVHGTGRWFEISNNEFLYLEDETNYQVPVDLFTRIHVFFSNDPITYGPWNNGGQDYVRIVKSYINTHK